MDPIEINAGTCYLRALRADRLMDDRPALAAAFADDTVRGALAGPGEVPEPGAYVALRVAGWSAGTGCAWAVAEPTTGDLLGEVGIGLGEPALGYCWIAREQRRRGLATAALGAALRFGAGALGLGRITFRHRSDDPAGAKLAAACGLTGGSPGQHGWVSWHTAPQPNPD